MTRETSEMILKFPAWGMKNDQGLSKNFFVLDTCIS